MMNTHHVQLPREVVVGRGVISQTGKICKALGFSGRTVIVTDPRVYEKVAGKLSESLERADLSIDYAIAEDSSFEYVNLVSRRIEKEKPAVVLGVGGGKAIDIAKLSSAKRGVPFISIPTAASHDGIGSAQASIKGSKKVFSIRARAPIAIIADIGLIMESPYRLTASGCGDIIAKDTAVRDWKLASVAVNEYYGDYAANLALMSSRLVMKSAGEIRKVKEDAIRTVVEALISCGVAMSIAGSSRPCSGSEHLFSHALDSVAPNRALHGEKCAIGTIMCAYLQEGSWKKIRATLKKVGTPTNAEELGVAPEDVVKALTVAPKVRPEGYTILNVKRLDSRTAENTAKATHVIG